MSTIDRYLLASASFVVRHWLTIMNVLLFLFIVPIVLAPYLYSTGNPLMVQVAGLIMAAYHVTCHQLPDRSLFVFGYEMAVCSRCFAIYAAFLVGGLAFYFLRTWLKPFHIFYYVLLCVPMAIDGTAQLFGIPIPRGVGPGFELVWTTLSNNEIRVITGAIFGLGSALFVLPYVQHIIESEDGPKKDSVGAKTNQQDP
ncbi:conserved hypothetical protein [Methanocella paludicola SANAE]|uniref:DUF2085 domain-containing protein n=1 Tax=Methanocella paludicola (strain DSM 17711 / JCM 13418 / NBRC 101707 / SANAE) TaxID=304371 RepID=D1Z241_METPS|nr:DUF2085 domain-containing protein [Methanocella paludicola]BAI62763.1 conserved hypothetical protein [Methanocella paludicola SANAE]